TEVALEKRKDCHATILTWSVGARTGGYYYYNFAFQVKTLEGETFYSAEQPVLINYYAEEKMTCHHDGVWCVKYTVAYEVGNIALLYAHQEFAHNGTIFKTPAPQNLRDDYYYLNCVEW
ncbi:hypothetical protein BGX24_009677, partial [Mortierella sp. AD032]